MIRKLLPLIALLPLTAYAQTPTCVQGQSGVAPTATLTFTAPTQNTDGTPISTPLTYNLYQSTTPGAETKIATALKGSPIAVSTGLSPGTTIYFKVSAVDAKGTESALSTEVCKVLPASIPNGIVTITIT